MKKLIFLILLAPFYILGQTDSKSEKKETKEKEEQAFKVVPLITSSPLMGFGFGAAASYLYNTKEDTSSKSQLQVAGQYSTTESYNASIQNSAWFNNNKTLSSTALTYSSINNDYAAEGEDIKYNTSTLSLSQLLLFKISQDIYLGTPINFRNIKHKANNDAGEDFLYENGFQNESSLGLGISSSYDTRTNKYFPVNATWISLHINANPAALGAVNDYYSTVLDARYYARGFGYNDVWAWQFYGQYSSKKTPDNGLPTLSGKTLLRGFPAGQYKAKYLSGAQTEYRYTINDSRFRLTGFVGLSHLSGGSFGVDGRSRDDDGWYSAGGVGVRYILQQVTGVDLRLDLVRTSKQNNAIYLVLNQAF